MATEKDSTTIANITLLKPLPDPLVTELLALVQRMSPEGVNRLIGAAMALVERFPRRSKPCPVITPGAWRKDASHE